MKTKEEMKSGWGAAILSGAPASKVPMKIRQMKKFMDEGDDLMYDVANKRFGFSKFGLEREYFSDGSEMILFSSESKEEVQIFLDGAFSVLAQFRDFAKKVYEITGGCYGLECKNKDLNTP